jgi:hypothetical protein
MHPQWLRVLGAIVFVWALLSAAMTWRSAAMRGPDLVTTLDSEFHTLAGLVPSSGPVGFLEHHADPDSDDNVLVYYVAQYACAPRLVMRRRTDLEFLLVARDAARPGRDERLVDFEPFAGSSSGHRLYRRRTR